MKFLNDPVSNFTIAFVGVTVAGIFAVIVILAKLFPQPEINRSTAAAWVRDHEERIKALEAK
jgi:hypothetical protein